MSDSFFHSPMSGVSVNSSHNSINSSNSSNSITSAKELRTPMYKMQALTVNSAKTNTNTNNNNNNNTSGNNTNRNKLQSSHSIFSINNKRQNSVSPKNNNHNPTSNNNIHNNDLSSTQLKKLIHHCLSNYRYSSAIFYADKLLSVDNNSIESLYIYSDTLLQSKQYKRAIHTIKTNLDTNNIIQYADNNINNKNNNNENNENESINLMNLKCLYLLSLCHFNCGEYEESLLSMGENDDQVRNLIQFYYNHSESNNTDNNNDNTASEINLFSSICCFRGELYEYLQNRPCSIQWHKLALQFDCKNVTAFNNLIDKHMLNYEESNELFQSLQFQSEEQWIKLIYQNKVLSYQYSNNANNNNNNEESKMEHDHKNDDSIELASNNKQSNSQIILANIETLENQYHLRSNLDILSSIIEHLYLCDEYTQCYNLCKKLIERDPHHSSILIIYIGCLVALENKIELFSIAHQLINNFQSDRSIAWYSVACYYFLIEKYELARKYYYKSTQFNSLNYYSWLGFGHSFAALDSDSDQSLTAYRTVARLFEGSHFPYQCIGIQYLKSNNSIGLAEQFLLQSLNIQPYDPITLNELGYIYYLKNEFQISIQYFTKAESVHSNKNSKTTETILINLAHSHRKLRNWNEAIKYYKKALSINNNSSLIYSSLGFTYHLMDNLDLAIEYYHRSLALIPNEAFTSEMLITALNQAAEMPINIA